MNVARLTLHAPGLAGVWPVFWGYSDAREFYERLGYEDGNVTVLGRWLR